MSQRYNFFYFEAEFRKYLTAGNAEESTIKNYLSDLHFFFSWLQGSTHLSEIEYSEMNTVFSASLVRSFSDYLASSSAAPQTISRRLATLRKFFSFCIDQQWLATNPAHIVRKDDRHQEKQDIITSYRGYLLRQNVSSSDLERQINIISSLIIN